MKLREYFYMTLIAVLGILLLYNWKCSGRCPVITQTTIEKHDTVFRDVKDSAESFKPVPIAVIKRKKDSLQPSEPIYLISQDSADIISDYFDIKLYDTTYNFQYGSIRVKNNVSENAIQYQQVIPDWKIPEKTTTITNTVTATEIKEVPLRRTQLYIGMGVLGNKQSILNGLEGSVSLKTKKDFIIEGAAIKLNNLPVIYKAGVKIKIHL